METLVSVTYRGFRPNYHPPGRWYGGTHSRHRNVVIVLLSVDSIQTKPHKSVVTEKKEGKDRERLIEL